MAVGCIDLRLHCSSLLVVTLTVIRREAGIEFRHENHAMIGKQDDQKECDALFAFRQLDVFSILVAFFSS